jgi:hypothetical protein
MKPTCKLFGTILDREPEEARGGGRGGGLVKASV